jgi:hypothetical protein
MQPVRVTCLENFASTLCCVAEDSAPWRWKGMVRPGVGKDGFLGVGRDDVAC